MPGPVVWSQRGVLSDGCRTGGMEGECHLGQPPPRGPSGGLRKGSVISDISSKDGTGNSSGLADTGSVEDVTRHRESVLQKAVLARVVAFSMDAGIRISHIFVYY